MQFAGSRQKAPKYKTWDKGESMERERKKVQIGLTYHPNPKSKTRSKGHAVSNHVSPAVCVYWMQKYAASTVCVRRLFFC